MSISFLEKVKEKFIMLLFTKKKVEPLPKIKVVPSEKFTPSEEFEKGNNVLNAMEYPVHTIHRKDLD